jgi:hypothetical protein
VRSRWETEAARLREVLKRAAPPKLNRTEEEQRRAEHFGQYGWRAYADPELI